MIWDILGMLCFIAAGCAVASAIVISSFAGTFNNIAMMAYGPIIIILCAAGGWFLS